MNKKMADYGSWKSSVTAEKIAAGTISLSQVVIDQEDIYWIEGRPTEGGRNTIVRRDKQGVVTDVIDSSHNARTRVHEYGGGSYVVSDGIIIYSNFLDQRLYRQGKTGRPTRLTSSQSGQRYADAVVNNISNQLICVNEDHSKSSSGDEPINQIVRLSSVIPSLNCHEVLVSGSDFYSNPRINSSGTKLCWVQWNHPSMPWDGCELWVGDLTQDGLKSPIKVAGGDKEAVFQPEWSPDDKLFYVSDKSGWWNLYRLDANLSKKVPEPVFPSQAEYATPMWVFGMKTYGFISAERIICTYTNKGIWSLGVIDFTLNKLTKFNLPYTDYSSINVLGDTAVFKAGSPKLSTAIVSIDVNSGAHLVISNPSTDMVQEEDISVPEIIEFPTENQLTAHGFFYPPKNRLFEGAKNTKPPLLVKIHGGPTGSTNSSLSPGIQYWTTRGFAILDINYGGSTGYGTPYRQRLDGKWGIVDVADCVNGAKHLVIRGDVDQNKLAIDGGSAGGFTTLAALAFSDVFKAGASFFGVTDLEALARDTHKFESRYLDRLIAPYPSQAAIWQDRSPINNIDKISSPVILFQGLEDKVVPPNQAESMVEALKSRGMQVAYIAYQGEQHGFRKAENIKRTLEAELYFYSKIFRFELPEEITAVDIYNFKS